MASAYDAIIIGGGHNGLICGAYLAKAGLRTLVLERRHVIGGAAVSEEIVPGFTFSVFSYVMSLLHPKVIRDLELRDFGLEVLPATDLFCPLEDDDYLIFSDDVAPHPGAVRPLLEEGRRELPGVLRPSRRGGDDRAQAPARDPARSQPARLESVQGDRIAALALSRARRRDLPDRRTCSPRAPTTTCRAGSRAT